MNGNNDPSAGSPTETLLRLILPLSVMACTTFWSSGEVQSEELAETLESVGATGGVYNGHPFTLWLGSAPAAGPGYATCSSSREPLSRRARLYLKRRSAHQHLVCELHPWACAVRAWLRVIHCCIFDVVTLPSSVTRATCAFRSKLGSRSFRNSPNNLMVSRPYHWPLA